MTELVVSKNSPLSQQWYEERQKANRLEREAVTLEKKERIVFEALKLHYLKSAEKVSVAKAEAMARTSEEYSKALHEAGAARFLANSSRDRAEALKLMYWENQSSSATERAVSRMG